MTVEGDREQFGAASELEVFPRQTGDWRPIREPTATVRRLETQPDRRLQTIAHEDKNTTTLVRDISLPWLVPLFVLPAALAIAWIAKLTQYKTFFDDEWALIATKRPWEWQLFLQPLDNGWSTIPILIWKILFQVFGIKSHFPYEAALLATHVVAAFALVLVIRTKAGDLPAFSSGLVLLLLGSGSENIVWAFQIGWVGSVALGLIAVQIAAGTTRLPLRLVAIAAALLGSLMCSSVGLAFLVALGAELIVDSKRKPILMALVVPTAAFVTWFVVFRIGSIPGASGRSGSLPHGQPSADFFMGLGAFVSSGLQSTAAAVVDLGIPNVVALIVVGSILAWIWARRGVGSWQVGMVIGLISWFVLAGIDRAHYGADDATQPRYIYVGVVFVLPLIANGIGQMPIRSVLLPTCAVLFGISLFSNTIQLRDEALSQADVMQVQSAELQTVEVFRGAPDMNPRHTIDDKVMPQLAAGDYLAATAELGSPVPHATLQSLTKLPSPAVDRVMANLFGDALTISPDKNRPITGLHCRDVDSTAGATMKFQAASGSSLMLEAAVDSKATLFLSYLGAPALDNPVKHAVFTGSTREWIHLPDTGKPIVWRVLVGTSPSGPIHICGGVSLEFLTADGVHQVDAATGAFDPAWSAVADTGAISGHAAEASHGAFGRYQNAILGEPEKIDTGPVDVWYRVRVADGTEPVREMTLGLWDDEGVRWLGSTLKRPIDIGISYTWIQAAHDVRVPTGHHVQFVASAASNVSTDWFIDEAAMVPGGRPSPGPYVYFADASTGRLDAGWAAVPDGATSSGHAAKASKATVTQHRNAVFGGNASVGGPELPGTERFDIWYRVRVANTAGTRKTMTLGLWDDEKFNWIASSSYSARQIGAAYTWLKVASEVSSIKGDHVQFVASFTGTLDTDWYIDQAALVPTGSTPLGP